uniref:WW and C2 domain containing 1 n=1 Tax=Oryzias sinensis TaxID=183150 RepID=A0A8C7YPD4_9TELE
QHPLDGGLNTDQTGGSGLRLENLFFQSEHTNIQQKLWGKSKLRTDFFQKLAVLKDGFELDSGSQQELWGSGPTTPSLQASIPRLFSDAGSQTDIPGEVSRSNKLAEKVRLSLKYEETKRRIATIEVQIAKLDSEAWPGLLDPERDRLILINEKEELLKELQYVSPRQRLEPNDAERLESERKRLEKDLQAARDNQSKALTERLRLHCRRSKLVRELEEMVRLATSLHMQLKSLSDSTLSCSSSSSRGSLTSSRASLATTSSLGSASSLSFTDIYLEQPELADPDLRIKLDTLLQEGGQVGYRPSSSITTIHEHEVVTAEPSRIQALRLTETPHSMSSLSPRSSLSSLSPPCSPLVSDTHFMPGDTFAGRAGSSGSGLDLELHSRLAELELDSDEKQAEVKLNHNVLSDGAKGEEPKTGVTSAVSDESVAGDSGVYEPSERKPGLPAEPFHGSGEDRLAPGCSQVQLGFRYESREQRFSVVVMQLSNCSALCLPAEQKTHVRLAMLPCTHATRCLFRTRSWLPQDVVLINEVFGMQISHSALRQKTLRVDVCTASKSGHEKCAAGAQISLADVSCVEDRCTRWFNLLSRVHSAPENNEDYGHDVIDLDLKGCLLRAAAGPSHSSLGFQVDVCSSGAVNKETSTENTAASHHCSVVRPKERRPDVHQNPFMRGHTIIRSKTFSPGPQSQYICRINRSDSDSSTLSKKSPFVRNASERRSMRMKKPPVPAKSLDGLLQTSLDLELDLQVSRTRQARLAQELRVLRELKRQLEKARTEGQKELPVWVQEDERFRLLLRQAEKQVLEQLQEKRVEKMMRTASKDVHKIRAQSRKELPEIQTFREKMAFFTRAKACIPDLPADSV